MQQRPTGKTTTRYLLLRIYSNSELQAYLTDMLAQGWIIDRCKGNFLTFRQQQIKGARLCVVSADCTKPSPKDDEQISEYINFALHLGWQLLCIGDFESLLPMRRRLYFYTCDPKVAPLEADEAIDFQNADRAYHSPLKWTIAWMLLMSAVLLSTVLFMLADSIQPVLIFLDAALLFAAYGAMSLCLDRRKLYLHVTKNTPMPEKSHIKLRKRENFMVGALCAVLLGIVLLLLS